MLNVKIVSSLQKVFIDSSIKDYEPLEKISALRGERLSFQLIYSYSGEKRHKFTRYHEPVISGELAKFATVREVKQLPLTRYDGDLSDPELADYLRTPPGLFPDPLVPLMQGKYFGICDNVLESLWIDIEIPRDMKAGEYTVSVRIDDVDTLVWQQYRGGGARTVGEAALTVEVINATLPEQTLKHTEWFYCDCLAEYYCVPVFSERHWQIIENYARCAVRCGVNMLLTPVFTPPLDTSVGVERKTVQLVGVKRTGGRYTFSWKLLDRWIEMCNRVGIRYLEISHLFTQWGAEHAPKIMATADGEYKQIFGWDTDAHGEEYKKFIKSFLRAFLKHMKARGDDKRCFFHVSDEPEAKHLENYKKSKRIVSGILKDYRIVDALSDIVFYKKGITKSPVPDVVHFSDFYKEGIAEPWTYYCGGNAGHSSRMIAKGSYNNRSLGMQMYKYGIEGFLHWGFNFYNTRGSLDSVNPLLDPSGHKWVPAGDTCLVYPAQDGTALESIRSTVFFEGLQDMRAMQLCETLYSHSEVALAIESVLGEELTFKRCARSSSEMLAVREKINEMIKERC